MKQLNLTLNDDVTYLVSCGSHTEEATGPNEAVDTLARMMYVGDRAGARYRLIRDGEYTAVYGLTEGNIYPKPDESTEGED